MKDSVVLSLLICIFHQAWSHEIPPKEDLCGLIVDSTFEENCLKCFTDAGHISQKPEEVRACVATYLPPIVAKCSVPHARRQIDRIQQFHPVTHHNHTNANLLPNCLKRRMRELSRYLELENKFAKDAGRIVKAVVTSNLIKSGGPNMLGVFSQKYILKIPVIKNVVAQSASHCLDVYNGENSDEDSGEDSNEDSDEDSDEDDDDDDDDDGDDDVEELRRALEFDSEWEDTNEPHLRSSFSSEGNGLPYGGTNSLAKEMILGKCIIDSLIETDNVMPLIQVITKDEFFYPIPAWWKLPLLQYYKTFRENLEGDSSR